MDFQTVIRERYSCKAFNGEKVKREQLSAILEAGRLAPTAKNTQEQKIYVLEKEEDLAGIDTLTPCRYGAPTCLLVAFNREAAYVYPGGKRDTGVEDAAIVATHMVLAAANAGVDSCWVNNFDPDAAAAKFQLPAGEEVLMIMDLGYAAADAAPLPNHESRKPLSETVVYR